MRASSESRGRDEEGRTAELAAQRIGQRSARSLETTNKTKLVPLYANFNSFHSFSTSLLFLGLDLSSSLNLLLKVLEEFRARAEYAQRVARFPFRLAALMVARLAPRLCSCAAGCLLTSYRPGNENR